MAEYNTKLQACNNSLRDILTQINNLPDAESGSGNGDTSIEDALVQKTLTTYANDRVTTIGSWAFYNQNNLSIISFPKCTSIDSYAFYNCGLQIVQLPVCTKICSSVFYQCTSLFRIYLLASSVCTLQNSNAFSNTNIKSTSGSIFVPASLVSAYKSATNWTYFSNRIFSYTG